MSQVYGAIKDRDHTVLENVLIGFEIVQDHATARKSWHGSFDLPSGKQLELGGSYRLILADGRSGDILISKIQISSIQFQGSGPLE